MPNTYTQINIHAVFAVKHRENIITRNYRDELHKYISGILTNLKQYPLAVNGWKDHVHIFFEMQPTSNLSDILQIVKANSSKWINTNNFVKGKFNWQNGFGGFSYSKSQRANVIRYIVNQEQHHEGISFKKEYLNLLEKFEIDFKDQYLFEFYE
ncbi:MAG: transposase [Bacteroidetes bacterium RIFOXYA12_FULL_35_11]|nr:MAG: transposase [Bacteroidetes bacterium GWF2_35_48]OFY78659.1 MAG: transposase [Bacteroidetes bacterium RIFOXYA12_FULL_35_11]OFY95263.1 MAG: transposase [Bacteroidetes bacterium RIFOXYB2_FULL_35_7]OFZ04833.1 MAG: transposase [Bacteroidetes bacterium RIFOXYC12_FULL_35_7]HBX52742.1 IS200/IS605 family transposase [Bacteroidales bacterium]